MTTRSMVCAFAPLLRWGATGGALITIGALLAATPSANAQTEASDDQGKSTTDSASPGEEEPPPVVDAEPPATEDKGQNTTPAEPEPTTQQQWPGEVSVEYVEAEKPEPEPTETGVYSKKVQGKLWLEFFVGPSSFDFDRFGYEFRSTFGSASTDLDLLPKVKGPQFGGAIGGTLFDQIFWIGASYRQANLEVGEGLGGFKLMKTGLEMQVVITPAPYVHPLLRAGVGYARVYGGNAAAAGLTFNGFYAIAGVGIRVPIVRWVSVFGTFDWSYTEVSPKGREVGGNLYARGSQLGGTFGMTLHFVGVK